MRRLAALVLTSALALPSFGQATPQPANIKEAEFEDAKAQLSEMARRFNRESGFMSIEGICAMACEHSHGTEYNLLWKECLSDAYAQMQGEKNLLMSYATRFDIMEVASYGTLLKGRMSFIEKHMEKYHSQPSQEAKSAKK